VSNLGQRVLVGVIAIPLILLLCIVGGPYFFAFIALVSAVALREFYALAQAKGAKPLVIVGIIGGLAVNACFFSAPTTAAPLLMYVLIVFVVVSALVELFHDNGSAILNLSTTLLGVLYISLFFGTLIGIRQLFVTDTFPVLRYLPAGTTLADAAHQVDRWGGYTVISMFATIWICDSAAFHIGVASGRHKLFPRVSPNKSWEGAIAGLIAALGAAVLAQRFLITYVPIAGALLIGGIVGTIGQLGDLTESLLKRDAGVKDSSTLIPGHGGAFDRFDSVLLVSPCVFLYLQFLFRA
jgi:phosphatidate cytidylyltransferase